MGHLQTFTTKGTCPILPVCQVLLPQMSSGIGCGLSPCLPTEGFVDLFHLLHR